MTIERAINETWGLIRHLEMGVRREPGVDEKVCRAAVRDIRDALRKIENALLDAPPPQQREERVA